VNDVRAGGTLTPRGTFYETPCAVERVRIRPTPRMAKDVVRLIKRCMFVFRFRGAAGVRGLGTLSPRILLDNPDIHLFMG
jgi:hypothetical protein